MAKNLRSKKYHTKNIRKKKKNKKKTYKNKINKNVKRVAWGGIREITVNHMETQFEQKEAIINYGSAPI